MQQPLGDEGRQANQRVNGNGRHQRSGARVDNGQDVHTQFLGLAGQVGVGHRAPDEVVGLVTPLRHGVAEVGHGPAGLVCPLDHHHRRPVDQRMQVLQALLVLLQPLGHAVGLGADPGEFVAPGDTGSHVEPTLAHGGQGRHQAFGAAAGRDTAPAAGEQTRDGGRADAGGGEGRLAALAAQDWPGVIVVAIAVNNTTDDSLDVIAVHLVGGILGAILLGFFADTKVNSLGFDGVFFGGGSKLLVNQFIAIGATFAFSFIVTYVVARIIDATIGLRVSAEEELVGLDQIQHSEAAQN